MFARYHTDHDPLGRGTGRGLGIDLTPAPDPTTPGEPPPGTAGVEDRAGPGWFVGSVTDGPHRRRVILRGDLGAVAADRLRRHLDEILRSTPVRHIVVDASDVRRCDPLILDILGQAHHQIAGRRGLITITGLTHGRHPHAAGTTRTIPGRPEPGTDHTRGRRSSARAVGATDSGSPASREHRGVATR